MPSILLIDSRRSFLDGRECYTARTNVQALKLLHEHENEIKAIWMDDTIQGKDGMKPVLDYLVFRAKLGKPYPTNVIFVHTQSETGWQVLNAKLSYNKYRVIRQTVRETLGAY